MNPDFEYREDAPPGRPRWLSTFLHSSASTRQYTWSPEELACVLRDRLATPVLQDLGKFEPRAFRVAQRLGCDESLSARSFSALFRHTRPPRELLEVVKDFAKAEARRQQSGLPPKVAYAIYFASIAAALVRLKRRISKLSDAELRRGFGWVAAQPWVDEETKQLARDGEAVLAEVPEGAAADEPAPGHTRLPARCRSRAAFFWEAELPGRA